MEVKEGIDHLADGSLCAEKISCCSQRAVSVLLAVTDYLSKFLGGFRG